MTAHTNHPGLHVPPPLVYVTGLALGLGLQRVVPLSLMPAGLRWLGVGLGWTLVALWPLCTGWALLTFFRARTAIMPNRTASCLVTHGPYRFTRNPMYVGMAVLYAGVVLLTNSAWSAALLLPVLFVVDRRIIPREERHLASRFGEAYAAYRARVRRWL